AGGTRRRCCTGSRSRSTTRSRSSSRSRSKCRGHDGRGAAAPSCPPFETCRDPKEERRMEKRLLCALACVAFVGCAGALQAVKRSPGKLENGEFKPERPATEKYGPDKTLACPEAGANGA